MDKMAKNVIMNKDCTLWRNDVSEKKQKGISGTDTDFTVWAEYDRSHCDFALMFGIWLGRKYDMLWIVIPLFIMGALAGFTNIFKMAKKIYGLGRKDGGRSKMLRRDSMMHCRDLFWELLCMESIVELAGVWFVTDKAAGTPQDF